jgi:hypothetical protein
VFEISITVDSKLLRGGLSKDGFDSDDADAFVLSIIFEHYFDAIKAISSKSRIEVTGGKVKGGTYQCLLQRGLLRVIACLDSALSRTGKENRSTQSSSTICILVSSVEKVFSRLSSELVPRLLPVVIGSLRRVLRACSQGLPDALPFTRRAIEIKYRPLLESCGKIVTRIASFSSSISKQIPMVIALIIESIADGRNARAVTLAMQPGIFGLLDKVPPRERARAHAALSQQVLLISNASF